MEKKDDKVVLEENLMDVYTNLNKGTGLDGLSKEQLEALKKSIESEFNLNEKVEAINIKFPKKRVIYVDGELQLVYDDGEFLLEDTVDSKKASKKLTKKKAMELYVEFFVRYTLNPLIEQKNLKSRAKEIIKVNNVKEKKVTTKEEKQKEVKTKAVKAKEKSKESLER